MNMQFTGKAAAVLTAVMVFCAAGSGYAAEIASGRINDPGYLGVSVERIPAVEKQERGISHGVIITAVQKDSPADAAGLKKDDVILYFNGRKMYRTDDLTAAVRETEPETRVNMKVLSGKQKKDVTVTVGRRDLKAFFPGGEGSGLLFGTLSSKGYLGVSLHTMDEDLAAYFKTDPEAGVLVLSVQDGSAAAAAGIKSGDVIVQIAGEDVRDPDHARMILDEFEKDDEITIRTLRSGAAKEVAAVLQGHSFGGGDFLETFIRPDRFRYRNWQDETAPPGRQFEIDALRTPGQIREIIINKGNEGDSSRSGTGADTSAVSSRKNVYKYFYMNYI